MALTVFLLFLVVMHVSAGVPYLAVPEGFDLVRGAWELIFAATCLFILFQRRVALLAFFVLSVVSIPFHLLKGGWPTVVLIGFGVPALIVLALVWNKRDQFR